VADDTICEAFMAIAELAIALGASPFNKFPGCWEHQVDDQWWVAVNGHREKKQCRHEGGMSATGADVSPFNAYVEYNGWCAGVISPCGGAFADGSCANEDEFIAALKAATERARRLGSAPKM
jgi:hypothetical protein